ncbi:MAG: trypsin-like peptidase domain-containing protein, partial [Ktedonobacteraceae bacterium]|nr:trypsin-like peptidase domain-containing protein [Ktedonobacteraceae bacterium]
MGEISPGWRPKKRAHDALTGAAQQSARFSISEMSQVRDSALSVALIKARRVHQGNFEYEETGTGWLIAPGLLLTCWHVVATLMDSNEPPPEAADMQRQLNDMLVFFNQTESTRSGIDYCVERLEFKGTQEQDFAILRLANRRYHPYEDFRYLPIEPDPPLTTQTQLFIIQHPQGEPQQVAIGGSFVGYTEISGRICYTTDTQPGTSGAPVLRRQSGCVVAIHNGKIVDEAIRSEGTHIDTILDTLQAQAPELYREIMREQGKLNKALSQALSSREPMTVVSATQREPHAALSSTASALQSGEAHTQPTLEPDRRLPRYTYLTAHTSTAPILCLTFDPTGKSLLYGAMADGIQCIDATTLYPMSPLKTCTKAVPSLALSVDGKYIGSGGDDGTVTLWHLAEQPSRYKTLRAHRDWVSCIAFSANGRYLLSGSDDGSLSILDIATRSSQILKKPTGVRTLACHPRQ